MNRRRIVLVIPTLDRGGAEKQLVLLARGLDRARFDVRVVALTRGGPLADELAAADIPLDIVGKTHKLDVSAYFRLEKLLRSQAPDLVHTWLFAANSYGRLAARRAGVRRIVAGERCVDPWKTWWHSWIDRYLAGRTDAIVVNSSAIRDFYVARGLPAEKFIRIPNGIAPHSAPTRDRGEFLRSLGLPAEARLVGTVARLWPQKRIDDLIWAIDLLREAYGNRFHLLIAGDGPQRRALERYRNQVHVDHLVHFLGVRDDVPTWLPHLDALWLGSEYEGQSNAVLEAMAAGVPVVATDIPGTRELLTHDVSGLLVPIGDRAAFARATRRLELEPELGPRLTNAARETVAREFSVSAMIERHATLYDRLLDG